MAAPCREDHAKLALACQADSGHVRKLAERASLHGGSVSKRAGNSVLATRQTITRYPGMA